MEIKDKIKNRRLELGLTLEEVAKKVGVAKSTVKKWESGQIASMRQSKITLLSSALQVSPTYFIFENSKFDESEYSASDITDIPHGVRIPVLGTIPAGVPIEAVEEVLGYEEIPEKLAKSGVYFALKVKGDSMLPTIQSGDTVIIKQTEDAESGKICAVMINGEDATLKEIKKEPNGIWILPHNPASSFKPHFFSNSQMDCPPVRILGEAVEVRRSL